ncbi:MAG: ATP synthase F0 subunit C [Ardenticatenaceae bacterium]
MDSVGLTNLGAGLAIGFAAIGGGVGVGLVVFAALQAMGRNPEATPEIRVNMFLGIAFAEAVAIYGLVISLILIFVQGG